MSGLLSKTGFTLMRWETTVASGVSLVSQGTFEFEVERQTSPNLAEKGMKGSRTAESQKGRE